MTKSTVAKNVVLQDGFSQVCIWPATIVGGKKKQKEFVKFMAENFDGVRVQYLEEIKTKKDESGPGGRNDLFFAIHKDDVTKFAIKRIADGIRWIEDVYRNHQDLYPARVAKYKHW